MIKSCDYCFEVFDDNYSSWCGLSNEDDNTFTILCSICTAYILSDFDGNREIFPFICPDCKGEYDCDVSINGFCVFPECDGDEYNLYHKYNCSVEVDRN
jgi:hypothetical protein